MRLLYLLSAAFVGSFLLVSSAIASRIDNTRLHCYLPSHSRILHANVQAQVYETSETLSQESGVFGCVFGSRHIYRLGEKYPPFGDGSEGSAGIAFGALAGSVVAYEYSVGSEGYKEWVVIVRNLRTGRVLRRVPSGPSKSPSSIGAGPVVAIVVKSDGSVAWMTESKNESPSRENEFVASREFIVFSVDKSGTHQLAVGKNIDPSSLALVGSTLYWTQGGVPASAHLI
ncbi:MAG: hypothetical protein WBV85_12420 [Solirubrobacteraceae bacterium]